MATPPPGTIPLVPQTRTPRTPIRPGFPPTLTSETTKGGTTVGSHDFGYDPNNNIATDTLTLQNAGGGANYNRTSTYTYDPNNQVTSVTHSDNHDNQTYKYDSSGNVIDQTVNSAQASPTSTTASSSRRTSRPASPSPPDPTYTTRWVGWTKSPTAT
jgi:YD repeat-containing protein